MMQSASMYAGEPVKYLDGQGQIINDIPSDSLIRLDKTGDESDFLNCYESSF